MLLLYVSLLDVLLTDVLLVDVLLLYVSLLDVLLQCATIISCYCCMYWLLAPSRDPPDSLDEPCRDMMSAVLICVKPGMGCVVM